MIEIFSVSLQLEQEPVAVGLTAKATALRAVSLPGNPTLQVRATIELFANPPQHKNANIANFVSVVAFQINETNEYQYQLTFPNIMWCK